MMATSGWLIVFNCIVLTLIVLQYILPAKLNRKLNALPPKLAMFIKVLIFTMIAVALILNAIVLLCILMITHRFNMLFA